MHHVLMMTPYADQGVWRDCVCPHDDPLPQFMLLRCMFAPVVVHGSSSSFVTKNGQHGISVEIAHTLSIHSGSSRATAHALHPFRFLQGNEIMCNLSKLTAQMV
eukprot:1155756-Pelagomonas_calceolata.AAC.1